MGADNGQLPEEGVQNANTDTGETSVVEESTDTGTAAVDNTAGNTSGTAGEATVGTTETADGGTVDTDVDLDAWNGELESLHEANWWAQIPEDVRGPLTAGIKSKYSNFHKGASKRIAEALDRADRKIVEAESLKAEADKQREYVTQLLATGDAPNDVLNKQLADLEQKLQAAEAAQETAIAEKLAAEKAQWQEEQAAKERDWEAEKAQWKQQEEQFQAMQEDYTRLQTEEINGAIEYANNVAQEKLPHIFENEELYGVYVKELSSDRYDNVDEVVEWMLYKYPAPTEPEVKEPEEPSPGVTHMTVGGTGKTSDGNADLYSARGFGDLRRRLRKQSRG